MKNAFAITKNVQRLLAGVQTLNDRGAGEANILLVTGAPGYGKTESVQWWAARNGAIYLHADPSWAPRWVAGALIRELSGAVPHATEARVERAKELLTAHLCPIVIDEAHHCLRQHAQILDSLRTITEHLELPLILVSMEQRIGPEIKKYQHLADRVSEMVRFAAADLDDVELCCRELAEVTVTTDLAEEVRDLTKGRFRLIVNAIARIERFGQQNGLTTVGRADMVGEVIAHDWRDNRPMRVRKYALRAAS